jgi:hypothetical protein
MVNRRDSPSGVWVCDVGRVERCKARKEMSEGRHIYSWAVKTALSNIL